MSEEMRKRYEAANPAWMSPLDYIGIGINIKKLNNMRNGVYDG
jgi:hypothetical protein